MRTILDTSGWYGFVSKDDEFHNSAVNFLKNKPFLLIPYPVFEELIAVLHHRKDKKDTLNALQALRNANIGRIVYLDDEQEDEIWNLYKPASLQIDYVDASVIWLAKRTNLPIFTFDKHFKKIGLKIVP